MRVSRIAEENESMQRRQEHFRIAAEYVSRELSRIDSVQKVALFGSVAGRLWEEVPRFREFRREGIAVLHECKDVDLAVWVSSPGDLRSLQKASARALNLLLAERNIGVAHHQVDVFILEPGTNRYLGRLCSFAACPKEGKMECLTPGCGAERFLRQHAKFGLDWNTMKSPGTVVLYERTREEQ